MRLALSVFALALAACQPSVAPLPPAETAPMQMPAVVIADVPAPEPIAVDPAPASVVDRAPPASHQYRADMTRSALRVFGPDAPVATLAAQIDVESRWRPDARSPVGALGIAQFMPTTAADMATRHRECAPANPLDPLWGFRCRDLYMRRQMASLSDMADGLTECDRWGLGSKGYNGGAGWVERDRRLTAARQANPDRWAEVNRHNAGRSAAAFAENSRYFPKMLDRQRRYAAWGRGVCA